MYLPAEGKYTTFRNVTGNVCSASLSQPSYQGRNCLGRSQCVGAVTVAFERCVLTQDCHSLARVCSID
jgi:hypothetical protein